MCCRHSGTAPVDAPVHRLRLGGYGLVLCLMGLLVLAVLAMLLVRLPGWAGALRLVARLGLSMVLEGMQASKSCRWPAVGVALV